MALTTSSQIGAPVNRVLQTDFLMLAQANCPHFLGSLQGELEEHAGSFTVLWQRIDAMTPTTSALTELSGNLSLPTRAATQISKTNVTATVAKYGDHIYMTEETDLTQPLTLREQVVKTLAIQAGRSLNRLQRNIMEDNTTLIYASGASADSGVTDIINRNLIKQAVNALDRNSAVPFVPMTMGSRNIGTGPINESYWGICHSDVREDISNLAGFTEVQSYAGQTPVLKGEFGYVERVRWITSPEASVDTDSGGSVSGTTLRSTTGTSADLYTSVVIGEQYHGSVGFGARHVKDVYRAGDSLPTILNIFKPKGSAGAGDPFDEIGTFAWKAWHAGAELNDNFGRGIRTGATDLTQ